MRASRALLASLGAGTALVLAGTLALAAVSAIVAFQGWPGLKTPSASAHQALALAPQPGRDEDGPGPVGRDIVVPAASRAVTRASAPRSARRAGARRPASASAPSTFARQAVTPPDASAGPTPAAPALAPSATQAPERPRPRARPGDATRELTDDLGGAVADTGSALDETLKPASPTLGETVGALTDGVGQTVKDVGATVGGAVDALAGTP